MKKKELLENFKYKQSIFKNVFQSENGQYVIKELEEYILYSPNFATENLKDDCMLREGAAEILREIKKTLDTDLDQFKETLDLVEETD